DRCVKPGGSLPSMVIRIPVDLDKDSLRNRVAAVLEAHWPHLTDEQFREIARIANPNLGFHAMDVRPGAMDCSWNRGEPCPHHPWEEWLKARLAMATASQIP